MKCTVALAVLLAAGTAHAFPTGTQFDDDPLAMAGAGGIPFDGAPRWSGHTCAVCHTDPPGAIGIRLEADRPELFTDGWKPGQQYHLRVVLVGQHEAVDAAAAKDHCGFNVTPFTRCDQNGFALELDTAKGKPIGKLVPVIGGACAATPNAAGDADARVLTDGTAATHSGTHAAMTAWDVCWTAPAAGAGTITAYLSVVDGNGGLGTEAFPNDAIGDDVASGAVPLAELGGDAPELQTGGCAAAGDSGLALVLGLGLALVLHRRRRLRRALLVACAVSLVAGCVHVRPRQRETLAKRKMKFGPDPAEDELDLHMQEAREGSSGGYGSSGGGCGCN